MVRTYTKIHTYGGTEFASCVGMYLTQVGIGTRVCVYFSILKPLTLTYPPFSCVFGVLVRGGVVARWRGGAVARVTGRSVSPLF